MAGHSKWANIQHRKKAQDNKRGKLFTKLIREITVAAKLGGAEAASNPRLRAAVEKALAGNMTRDTINRAITRGAGGGDGAQMEEIRYEGYGPGGVAIMVDCMTDNRNRTVSEVRHAFSKHGGNLGTEGSVSYLFTHQGQLLFAPGANEDQVMEAALEGGAMDVETLDDGSICVITAPEELMNVKDALSAQDLHPDHFEATMVPANEVELSDELQEKVQRILDRLEGLDDVQDVYSNARVELGDVE